MPKLKLRHVDDPAAFAERLRRARAEAGLSQERLAFAGCSAAYISLLEAGTRVPSLQVVRELARRLGVEEDFLARGETTHASLLVDAEIALRLGDAAGAQDIYELVVAEARGEEAAAAFEGLGELAFASSGPHQAIAHFERALRETGEHPSDRPRLAESLGRCYAQLGQLAPAIEVFRSCVERFRREGDPILLIRFSCLLGYALTDNGDFDQAEQVVASALALGREINDPYTRARLYWSQSRLLLEQGKSDLAEGYALKTLELLRATEDDYALAHAYQSLAHIYLDLGRPSEAHELLTEGWPLLLKSGTPAERAHYQIDEARALAALGQKHQAAAIVMDVPARLGDMQPVDRGRSYLLLAEVFDDLEEHERARELYELAIELLEGGGTTRYLLEGYTRLASLLKRAGDSGAALELLERALGLQANTGRLIRS